MILKTLLLFLFVSGSLADDKQFTGEIQDMNANSEEKEGRVSQRYRPAGYDSVQQFKKDFERWNPTERSEDARDSVSVNEIDDGMYVDKYNKNGYVLNSKRKSGKPSKHPTLLGDVDVNYVNNHKKYAPDSEMLDVEVIKKRREDQVRSDKLGEKPKKTTHYNMKMLTFSDMPPVNDTILMARYIVHAVDWAAVGTLSGRPSTKGAPFVCVKATSDGPKDSATGIPFFYLSPRDLCSQDLERDNRVSVVVTLSQTEYCKKQNLDPQDPRCAKVTLSGKIKKLLIGSEEEKFVKNAVFSRHPQMVNWPADHDWYFTKMRVDQVFLVDQYGLAKVLKARDYLNDHDWYFAKMKIGQVILLDQYGGATFIKVKDYLNGAPTN